MTPTPSVSEPAVLRVACRYGEMFVPGRDLYIGRSLMVYGEYAEGEQRLFRSYLRAGASVVDVGANIGAHTLGFAALSPSSRIVAIEPQQALAELLRRNLALNAVVNVDVVEAVAGAAPGLMHLREPDIAVPSNLGRYSARDTPGGRPVPVITLDALNLMDCGFIKCDVEGMEREVLLGAQATIRRDRPVLYVENDRAEKAVALVALLHDLEYRTWWHMPTYYQPDNFNGRTDDVFEGLCAANLLCLHRSRTDIPKGFVEIRRPQSAWPPISFTAAP